MKVTNQLVRERRIDNAPERRIAEVASYFVESKRVVPGLTVEPSGPRSWWWPLPTASDRDVLRSIVDGTSVDDHRVAAAALADAVDALMRERLVGVTLLETNRRGRRTVPEAWLVSLTAADPSLPPTLDPKKVAEFASSVQAWVRTGAPTASQVRIVLRVNEPVDAGPWRLELLAQDPDEPTLIVPAEELWSGAVFPPSAVADLLSGLGRIVRIAPELAALLDTARPTGIELSAESVVAFVRDRVGALADAGIGVALPAWWSARGRVRLRAKATSKRSSSTDSTRRAGLGFDQLVSFTWEAALGDRKPGSTEQLDDAIRAYNAALEVFSRETEPMKWAIAQMNLGTALVRIGDHRDKRRNWLAAAGALVPALEVFEQHGATAYADVTRRNLRRFNDSWDNPVVAPAPPTSMASEPAPKPRLAKAG